jgi:hypothetical protein
LSYKIKDSTEEKRIIRYIVDLTTTDLPWGGKRFWFQCPIIGCRNRVAKLYLPPNSVYFGCRNCHNLTYRSSQEQRAFASLYRSLANSLIGNYPGITPNHVKSVLSKRYEEGQFRDIFDDSHNKHESYLTREELLFESGLSEDRLNIIENAKLLLPDYKRLYRPKLVGWVKKLGYLLGDNWKIEEIYKWAKGRWSTPSPKKWPPDQDYWKTKDKE